MEQAKKLLESNTVEFRVEAAGREGPQHRPPRRNAKPTPPGDRSRRQLSNRDAKTHRRSRRARPHAKPRTPLHGPDDRQ